MGDTSPAHKFISGSLPRDTGQDTSDVQGTRLCVHEGPSAPTQPLSCSEMHLQPLVSWRPLGLP